MPTLPGRPLFLLPCLGHTLDRGRGFSHCAAPFLFSCLFLQDLRLSRFPRPAPRVDLNHRALLCHLLRGLFLGLIVIVGKLGEEMRILYGVIAIGVVIKRRFRYLWSVNPWRREMHRVGLTKQLLCVFFEGCLTIKVTFSCLPYTSFVRSIPIFSTWILLAVLLSAIMMGGAHCINRPRAKSRYATWI